MSFNFRNEILKFLQNNIAKTFHNSCEDYYTIVLNSRLSYSQNVQAYFHELKHIECNDFNSNMPATVLEQIRHA